MKVLAPDCIRCDSLDELAASPNAATTLICAPVPVTAQAQAYALTLRHHTAARQRQQTDIMPTPCLSVDVSNAFNQQPGFNSHLLLETLQKKFPPADGKEQFIDTLMTAALAFNKAKERREGRGMSVFRLQEGQRPEHFRWHEDSIALMSLTGHPTCWRTADMPAGQYRTMEPYDLNIWNGLTHSAAPARLSTEKRLLALFM